MSQVFEDEFMQWHASLVGLCKELAAGRADTIYIYCCMEKCEKMFDAFFSANGTVYTTGELNVPDDVQWQFLDYGMQDMLQIIAVCKKHGRPAPTEIKMVYDVRTRRLQTKYRYQEYLDAEGICSEQVFWRWIKEIDPEHDTLC